jgi:hypothetical protein
MSPYLQNCPNEVIETIVVLLDLEDVCNLRHTCRALDVKCTQGHFRSFFISKHVDITGSDLREFVDMTQRGGLGCQIQHLVLVGVVNNTELLKSILREKGQDKEEEDEDEEDEDEEDEDEEDDEEESDLEEKGTPPKAQQDLEILKQRQIDYVQLHESGTDVSLLSEAFSNIMSNGKAGKLLSLSLEVVVYREDTEKRLPPLGPSSWKLIWQSAAETFHTAIRSLAASSLPIEKLNIFNSRQLQRCSLASNELGSIDFEHKGLAVSLASLKSLSVSFSGKVIYNSKKDAKQSGDPAEKIGKNYWGGKTRPINDMKAEAADEINFIGLRKILELCSQLEELELHQYWIGTGLLAPADLHYERLFRLAAEIDVLPHLKRIELRGSDVREEDLLAFIQRTGVRKLSMYKVRLSFGTFRSIFNYCTSEAASMEELCFHELFETGGRVFFDGPGPCQFPPQTGPGGTDTLWRISAEVRQQISYYSAGAPMVGSPATAEYLLKRYIEYGPPIKGC